MNHPRKLSLTTAALFAALSLSAAAAARKPVPVPDYTKTPDRFVSVDGVRYAYRTIGENPAAPPLVLFQHFTGTMDDWDSELIEGLARNRRVIVFDNAGVSATSGTTPDNVAAMAASAEKFIDALRLGKIDVLGYSLGGCVAQQVIADRSDLVRKAIIAGSSAKGGDGVKDMPGGLARATKASKETGIPLKRILFFSRTPLGLAEGEAFLKRIDNHTVDKENDVSAATVQAQLKALVAWGSEAPNFRELETIKQPVLIVNGSNDEMMATINSYAMFKHIPNSHLILYPDSGHGAIFQYRKLFVSQVDAFLD